MGCGYRLHYNKTATSLVPPHILYRHAIINTPFTILVDGGVEVQYHIENAGRMPLFPAINCRSCSEKAVNVSKSVNAFTAQTKNMLFNVVNQHR